MGNEKGQKGADTTLLDLQRPKVSTKPGSFEEDLDMALRAIGLFEGMPAIKEVRGTTRERIETSVVTRIAQLQAESFDTLSLRRVVSDMPDYQKRWYLILGIFASHFTRLISEHQLQIISHGAGNNATMLAAPLLDADELIRFAGSIQKVIAKIKLTYKMQTPESRDADYQPLRAFLAELKRIHINKKYIEDEPVLMQEIEAALIMSGFMESAKTLEDSDKTTLKEKITLRKLLKEFKERMQNGDVDDTQSHPEKAENVISLRDVSEWIHMLQKIQGLERVIPEGLDEERIQNLHADVLMRKVNEAVAKLNPLLRIRLKKGEYRDKQIREIGEVEASLREAFADIEMVHRQLVEDQNEWVVRILPENMDKASHKMLKDFLMNIATALQYVRLITPISDRQAKVQGPHTRFSRLVQPLYYEVTTLVKGLVKKAEEIKYHFDPSRKDQDECEGDMFTEERSPEQMRDEVRSNVLADAIQELDSLGNEKEYTQLTAQKVFTHLDNAGYLLNRLAQDSEKKMVEARDKKYNGKLGPELIGALDNLEKRLSVIVIDLAKLFDPNSNLLDIFPHFKDEIERSRKLRTDTLDFTEEYNVKIEELKKELDKKEVDKERVNQLVLQLTNIIAAASRSINPLLRQSMMKDWDAINLLLSDYFTKPVKGLEMRRTAIQNAMNEEDFERACHFMTGYFLHEEEEQEKRRRSVVQKLDDFSTLCTQLPSLINQRELLRRADEDDLRIALESLHTARMLFEEGKEAVVAASEDIVASLTTTIEKLNSCSDRNRALLTEFIAATGKFIEWCQLETERMSEDDIEKKKAEVVKREEQLRQYIQNM